MNDYKELLKALRSCQHIASNCIDCPLANTKYYNPKTHECEVHLHNIASDAIEQLVKENYEWCLTYSDHCANSQNEIKRLTKERDAAIYEMRREADNCKWCRWHDKDHPIKSCVCPETCCVDGNPDRWEWRGVQK